ncbi:hypothetical protein [Pseudomonas aeruginosa]|nr:hypothetical protein [Pseudomonas aeruginosa]
MTPHAFARWNLLLLVASIFAGLVFAPSADLSALPTPEDRKWVLAEVPSVAVDTTVAGKLAGMSWWGRTVDEEREAESKRVSVGVDGVALIKVDWLLRGIVRDEGGIFALVAKSAEGPLRRFAAGATLPGGERLESITEQGIRFSFSQDGNTQGFERKLYAPLPWAELCLLAPPVVRCRLSGPIGRLQYFPIAVSRTIAREVGKSQGNRGRSPGERRRKESSGIVGCSEDGVQWHAHIASVDRRRCSRSNGQGDPRRQEG